MRCTSTPGWAWADCPLARTGAGKREEPGVRGEREGRDGGRWAGKSCLVVELGVEALLVAAVLMAADEWGEDEDGDSANCGAG